MRADMSGNDMRSALQCAIENRRVQIIRVLIAPNPSLVKKLDFLALYRTEHRIFLDLAQARLLLQLLRELLRSAHAAARAKSRTASRARPRGR